MRGERVEEAKKNGTKTVVTTMAVMAPFLLGLGTWLWVAGGRVNGIEFTISQLKKDIESAEKDRNRIREQTQLVADKDLDRLRQELKDARAVNDMILAAIGTIQVAEATSNAQLEAIHATVQDLKVEMKDLHKEVQQAATRTRSP
jgi:outer membrane murein-binding lipoprotein Lpp